MPPRKRKKEAAPEASRSSLTVVGIGASAGGLPALRSLFANVPEDSGLVFVVVVHLAPAHESHLAELLQPDARIPVTQVSEPTPVEPNHAYVIPPGFNISVTREGLELTRLEQHRGDRAPVDHFFRTLAAVHDGHAVGVILSGTGSDGTLGIREIRECGGLVIVQDPTEAEYDGMPRHALATGMVDIVSPVAEIPQRILEFDTTEPRIWPPPGGAELDRQTRELVNRILAQVQIRTGHDFAGYKRPTILRRIERRMQILRVEQLGAYLDVLHEKGGEVDALADDLLINVTHFFRDAAVFSTLAEEAVPRMFEGKRANERVRVWSVGCATGEEAYSLAMLLLEEAARRDEPPHVQVFATDLHERSLAYGREGLYPETIAVDVGAERLNRFFVREDGAYRVRKELRDAVIFARHNLLQDPPFSQLDLVSCRNVMIYLQRPVQEEVLELFHYALRDSGFLLLGTAETLERSELFRVENKKHHLYRRRSLGDGHPVVPRLPQPSRPPAHWPATRARAEPGGAFASVHRKMVELYAPPSLLVNQEDQVVHLSDHAGRYLGHPGGTPTSNVMRLVREELRTELRTALHLARERRETTKSNPIRVRFNGETGRVVLHVTPSSDPDLEGLTLVVFEEVRTGEGREGEGDGEGEGEGDAERSDGSLAGLESELETTRTRLKVVLEEYDATREELRGYIEELQSANEELRSTMEELETSKEELQSINEELQTTNQENRHKVEELSQLSADLQNLLKATDVATIFLDRGLRILRFTPRVGELFNIRHTDRGRPLSDLTHRLGGDGVIGDARKVLDTLIPVEREVASEDGRWHLVRVIPYRTPDERIEGVVVTLVDVTALKRAEELIQAQLEEKTALLSEVHHRVKNNLQIISSLLNLQINSLQDPVAVEALRDSQDRTRAIALVHETLYKSGDFARVDLADYLKQLASQIRRSTGMSESVRMHLTLGSCTVPLNQAVACGLIMNELITNALKHGFPDGASGEVRLSLGVSDDGRCTLTVSDTGVGLDDRADIEAPRSVGMQLVSMLTRQLKGELRVRRDRGAEVTLTFPIGEE